MEVILESYTSVAVLVKAIRMCTATQCYSDSTTGELGVKDQELCYRAMTRDQTPNHILSDSPMEHLNYTFSILGIPEGVLLEVQRHRHSYQPYENWDGREISLSVQSSRFTLKKLGVAYMEVDDPDLADGLKRIHEIIEEKRAAGMKNDKLKFMLTQATLYNLVMTINGRSLRNFLSQRTFTNALMQTRSLAMLIFKELPMEHRFLYENFCHGGEKQ